MKEWIYTVVKLCAWRAKCLLHCIQDWAAFNGERMFLTDIWNIHTPCKQHSLEAETSIFTMVITTKHFVNMMSSARYPQQCSNSQIVSAHSHYHTCQVIVHLEIHTSPHSPYFKICFGNIQSYLSLHYVQRYKKKEKSEQALLYSVHDATVDAAKSHNAIIKVTI